MNIKTLSELFYKSGARIENVDIFEILELLIESANQSKKIILESVSEKDFVGMCRIVKFAAMAAMLSKGEGQAIVLADKAEELDGMLDTYALSILGILMREEIV